VPSWHVRAEFNFSGRFSISTGKIFLIFWKFKRLPSFCLTFFQKILLKQKLHMRDLIVSHGDECKYYWWPCGTWRRLDFRLYQLFRGIRIFHLQGWGQRVFSERP
jgi:hypothetical protein